MYDAPYLETCCRSALHRLVLAGAAGRPAASKDAACLDRLVVAGLAAAQPADAPPERYCLTEAGRRRHAAAILRPAPG